MDKRDEHTPADDDTASTTLHVASAHCPVRLRVASVTTSTPVVGAPKGGALKAVVATTHVNVPRQRR